MHTNELKCNKVWMGRKSDESENFIVLTCNFFKCDKDCILYTIIFYGKAWWQHCYRTHLLVKALRSFNLSMLNIFSKQFNRWNANAANWTPKILQVYSQCIHRPGMLGIDRYQIFCITVLAQLNTYMHISYCSKH